MRSSTRPTRLASWPSRHSTMPLLVREVAMKCSSHSNMTQSLTPSPRRATRTPPSSCSSCGTTWYVPPLEHNLESQHADSDRPSGPRPRPRLPPSPLLRPRRKPPRRKPLLHPPPLRRPRPRRRGGYIRRGKSEGSRFGAWDIWDNKRLGSTVPVVLEGSVGC
jgi:hypothetical protein